MTAAAQPKPQIVDAVPHGSTPSPEDLKMFALLGIDAKLLEAARVVRVSDHEARQYGITLPGNLSGLLFPYFIPGANGYRATCRLRRDHPEELNGKPENKYVCPTGDAKRLYFPPGAAESLADSKTSIVFVEAEKSALAMTAWAARMRRKLVTIATGGCWGWRSKIGTFTSATGKRKAKTGPSPDLDCAKGRDVAILFDSNAASNEKVQKARLAFAQALMKLGARVAVLDLPASDGVNGPDDFIGMKGDAAMVALFTKPAPTATQPEVPGRVPITEMSNAERFLAKCLEDFRHCSDRGVWTVWNGKLWVVDDQGAAMRAMQEVTRDIYFEAARETFEDRRQQLAEWAMRSDSRRTQENSLALARFMKGIEVFKFGEVFDRRPRLLNVNNGTIELDTGTLRPHRREDFLTKMVPINYDPDAKCGEYMKFLSKTFDNCPALVAYALKFSGYCLSGLTEEQSFWMLCGATASGKSTWVRILRGILGPYAYALPESYFLLTKKTSDFTKAHLAGVRFATCVETNEGKRLDVAKIKELTGGDIVCAEFKHQNEFEFKPEAKLALVTNYAPHVSAGDDAFWRRLNILPFNRTVAKNEQTPDLAEQLLEKEGPGILRSAVQGFLDWRKFRLDEPREVETAVEEYRNREDDVKDFLNDFCVKSETEKISRKDLYVKFATTRKEMNQKYIMSAVTFGRELSRIGVHGDDGKRYWTGIRLRELGDPESSEKEWG